MGNIVYYSLDDARDEFRRRALDTELKAKIEAELGNFFMPHFHNKILAVSTRQLASPDNGLNFFVQCARYIGATPLVQEFLGDTFVHFNEEKKGLARLRVMLSDGKKATVDIMDFHGNEKTALGNCILKTGENLADFHHKLISLDRLDIDIIDNTQWYRKIGRASDYYYFLLLHFVAHGVLFESFLDEEDSDASEKAFTRDVVIPAIKRIKTLSGVNPIIVRSYPEQQTEEEDFYWWSHSQIINDFILTYAKQNNLPLKEFQFKGSDSSI